MAPLEAEALDGIVYQRLLAAEWQMIARYLAENDTNCFETRDCDTYFDEDNEAECEACRKKVLNRRIGRAIVATGAKYIKWEER